MCGNATTYVDMSYVVLVVGTLTEATISLIDRGHGFKS
jgi:hypothetical protein